MAIPAELIMRYFSNLIKIKIFRNMNLDPIIASLFVTSKCNFKCIYCDDGNNRSYNDLNISPSDTDTIKKLLKIIRKKCSFLNITGGEPLLRSDIIEILKEARKLKFNPIMFNTNAFLLDKKIEVLNYVDFLTVSLDAWDDAKNGKIIQRPREISKKVKDNILLAAKLRNQYKFNMIINSVIMEDNIEECKKIMRFCFENKINYSPMPRIKGKDPDSKLVNNKHYQDFIKEVIANKIKKKPIFGILPSLKKILYFERYECYPTLKMNIFPNGDVYYPCSPLNTIAGNLIKEGDFDKVLKEGIKKYGRIKKCQYTCHVSCYLEPSLSMTHPIHSLLEYI